MATRRKSADRRKGKRATLDRKQQRAFKRAIQGRDPKITHP